MTTPDDIEKSYRAYLVAFLRSATGAIADAHDSLHEETGAALGARDGIRLRAAGNNLAPSDLGSLPMPRKAFMSALSDLLAGADMVPRQLSPKAKMLASDLCERILSGAFGDESLQSSARDLQTLIEPAT